jgi:transcriptional regulator with XRE-family HTH domain
MKAITEQIEAIDHIKTGRAARAEREDSGLSLRMTAIRMDISASFLSDLERGRRNWNADHIRAFNQAIRDTLGKGKRK